ncbi:hypothetical protein K435DRAFT_872356 [Dendrothele bispora CBS 962.96]|uniref:Uncharacterized protein n=1 Tax=Dendrothele bispora (strain CBS 962.96) TaxID=1314807 RepID=A0A4S8L1S3_DENBC|nr:hypothetical protein K435DRAFT_872356 [Dendrothele bispora CBS 962.96]
MVNTHSTASRSSSRLQGRAAPPVEQSIQTTKKKKKAASSNPVSSSTKRQQKLKKAIENILTEPGTPGQDVAAQIRPESGSAVAPTSNPPDHLDEQSPASPEPLPEAGSATEYSACDSALIPTIEAATFAESEPVIESAAVLDSDHDSALIPSIDPTPFAESEPVVASAPVLDMQAEDVQPTESLQEEVTSPSFDLLSRPRSSSTSAPTETLHAHERVSGFEDSPGVDDALSEVRITDPGGTSTMLSTNTLQNVRRIGNKMRTNSSTHNRKAPFKPRPVLAPDTSPPPKPARPISPLPLPPSSPVRSFNNARNSVPPSDPLDEWNMTKAMDDYSMHGDLNDYVDDGADPLPAVGVLLDDHRWVFDENDYSEAKDREEEGGEEDNGEVQAVQEDDTDEEEEEEMQVEGGGEGEGDEDEDEEGVEDEEETEDEDKDEEGVEDEDEEGGVEDEDEEGIEDEEGVEDEDEEGAEDEDEEGVEDEDEDEEGVEDEDEDEEGMEDEEEEEEEDGHEDEGGGEGEREEEGEGEEREKHEEDEGEEAGEDEKEKARERQKKLETLHQYKAGREERRRRREQEHQVDTGHANDDFDDPPLEPKRHYGNSLTFKSKPTREDTSNASKVGASKQKDGASSRQFSTSIRRRATSTSSGDEQENEDDLGIQVDVGEDDTEDESDDFDSKSKPGPIPEKYRRQAFEAANLYNETLKKIVRNASKPVQAFYKLVGQRRWMPRGPNYWNMAQQYITDPEGGNESKPDNSNETEIAWKQRRWEEMRKEVLGNDWQNKKRENAQPSIMKGLSERGVRRIADDFVNLADHAAKNRGVCCLGYVLDYHGNHSIMWGAGTVYERMRDMYNTQIDQQIKDLVALARGAYIKERDGESEVDPNYVDFVFRSVDCDPNVTHIAASLRMCHDETFDWKTQRFPWHKFADIGLKRQIRIENWSDVVPPPGNGLRTLKLDAYTSGLYDLSYYALKKIQWEKAVLDGEGDGEDDKLDQEVDNKVLRIVAWTDAQKALSPEQQGDVPLVVSVSGRTLCTGKNAKTWRASGAPAKEKGKTAGKKRQDTKFARVRSPVNSHSRSQSPSGSRPPSRLPSPALQFARSPSNSQSRGRSVSPAHSPFRGRGHSRSRSYRRSHSRSHRRSCSRSRSRSLYHRRDRYAYSRSPSRRGDEHRTRPRWHSPPSAGPSRILPIDRANKDNPPKPPRRTERFPAHDGEHPAGTSKTRNHQASHEDPRLKRSRIDWEKEYEADHREERPNKKKKVEFSAGKNDRRVVDKYGGNSSKGKGKERVRDPEHENYRKRK